MNAFCRPASSTAGLHFTILFAAVILFGGLVRPLPLHAANIALVNGTPITQDDLEEAVLRLQRQMADQGASLTVDRSRLKEDALAALIDRRLLVLKSRESGIAVAEREVDAYLEQVRSSYADEAACQEALADLGLTEAVLRERFKQDAMVNKLIEEKVGAKITVSEDEVAAFYQAHMAHFVKPGQVRAAHILIRVPANAGNDQKARALDQIVALRNRLLRGEDFAALAIEYSQGPSSLRGGDLGYFVRAQVEKPLADAAFSLHIGEISEVVETSLGFHILRVMDRRPPSAISLDSVRERLGRRIRKAKIAMETENYLSGLRASARIERLDTPPLRP